MHAGPVYHSCFSTDHSIVVAQFLVTRHAGWVVLWQRPLFFSVMRSSLLLLVPNFVMEVRNICARGGFSLQTIFDFLNSHF